MCIVLPKSYSLNYFIVNNSVDVHFFFARTSCLRCIWHPKKNLNPEEQTFRGSVIHFVNLVPPSNNCSKLTLNNLCGVLVEQSFLLSFRLIGEDMLIFTYRNRV